MKEGNIVKIHIYIYNIIVEIVLRNIYISIWIIWTYFKKKSFCKIEICLTIQTKLLIIKKLLLIIKNY